MSEATVTMYTNIQGLGAAKQLRSFTAYMSPTHSHFVAIQVPLSSISIRGNEVSIKV